MLTCEQALELISAQLDGVLWNRHGSPQGLKMPSLRI